jgi:uncharacterized membrane protein YphA (DoxX/SURF4 family)
MTTLRQEFHRFDVRLTRWLARHGVTLLRISIGIVYFWFGVLKFFPNLSPAQDLAARTIEMLTFGIVPPAVALFVLAIWECAIGIGLISGKFMRVTLLLLVVQMLGTVTPLFLFPQETWTVFPIAPTLEGQYIIKNIIIVSAALVLGATVRGGAMVDDPKVARAYHQQAEAGAGD